MKKYLQYISILIVVILLSGCSIDYQLNFIDGSLIEEINVTLDGDDYTSDKIDSLKSFELMAISKGLEQIKYDSVFEDKGDSFLGNYQYTYSIDNFSKNNVLSRCYDAFALTKTDSYYLLSTSKTFKCLSIEYQTVDEYKISIKTNHKVLEHNADEVEDDEYIWRLYNNGNEVSMEKPITIKFSKEIVENKSLFDNYIVTIFVVFLAIAMIGGIIVLVAYRKNQESNKI